jgi:hypothetical protein
MNYSVCITTFNGRFDLFKNIVSKVKKQREDVEFIILANGLTNLPFDEEYRKNLLEFISPFKNTFPIVFPEFRGLSKLWNTGCQLASNNYVLMISDDIDIDDNFFDEYEETLLKFPNDCFTINNNFCGFHINKVILDKLNWFDERFLSIGSEDLWFIESHCAVMGYNVPHVEIKSYHNNFELDWQKNLIENEVRMENQNHGGERYSPFNYEVFKYMLSGRHIFDKEEYPPYVSQYPHEKFFWEFKNTY